MVSYSLYRGNLHQVPNQPPREWEMPKHELSLKDFRRLYYIQNKIKPPSHSSQQDGAVKLLRDDEEGGCVDEVVGESGGGCSKGEGDVDDVVVAMDVIEIGDGGEEEGVVSGEGKKKVVVMEEMKEEGKEEIGGLEGGVTAVQKEKEAGKGKAKGTGRGGRRGKGKEKAVAGKEEGKVATEKEKAEKEEEEAGKGKGKGKIDGNAELKINNNVELLKEKVKRKEHVEQKLQILHQNKHNLVQMLKQIQNAEELMKRRNGMQIPVARAPAPPQAESTIDARCSNLRQNLTRLGSERANNGELEGESDDLSNHNAQPRHIFQRHSSSPSASSPLRRPPQNLSQQNPVHHLNRPSPGGNAHFPSISNGISMGGGATIASPSPSRFAPAVHHNNQLPPLSISVTNLSASSPSPAASGETSVFRENSRLTSPPWN